MSLREKQDFEIQPDRMTEIFVGPAVAILPFVCAVGEAGEAG